MGFLPSTVVANEIPGLPKLQGCSVSRWPLLLMEEIPNNHRKDVKKNLVHNGISTTFTSTGDRRISSINSMPKTSPPCSEKKHPVPEANHLWYLPGASGHPVVVG